VTAAPRFGPSLERTPRLSRWLRLAGGDTVEVLTGKAELGQGIATALARIVAEELDVDISRVRMVAPSTAVSPDEGFTAGSLSVQHSGGALRQVSAEARALLLAAAAARLAADVGQLSVRDGVVRVGRAGPSCTYWEVATPELLQVDATGNVSPKPPLADGSAAVGRLDLPDKVFGRPRYLHDLRLPDQAYGRVVRPPSRAAVLAWVDGAAVESMPGVLCVVRDGSFVGVVARTEAEAERAAAGLAQGCRWDERDCIPDGADAPDFLRAAPAERVVLHESDSAPGEEPGLRTYRWSFHRHHLAHAPMGPSCAVARWERDELRVWSSSQGVHNLRSDLARALELDPAAVRVDHVEGPGCYGHTGVDDAALDAALLARAVPGRPVQVLWSRQDEFAWSPLGPAMAVEVTATVGAAGRLVHWTQEIWGGGHTSRPTSLAEPAFLAQEHRAGGRALPPAGDPSPAAGYGAARNAIPGYHIGGVTVVNHRLLTAPVRTSALRSLGAHLNVFAIESVIDDLALEVGRDPLEFRLEHLVDERARAVLLAAAERAGWGQAPAAGDTGRGLAVARYKGVGAYCAVVADVRAEESLRVERLVVAVDVGRVVDADGVRNQIEGGAIQATSWSILERVRLDRRRVTSDTWETYPILTFSTVPAVEVLVLDRPDQPSVGSGEAAGGPTAAAIGNALRTAIGVRVRELPMSSEAIVRAMDAAPAP